jgi:hypothetical protein
MAAFVAYVFRLTMGSVYRRHLRCIEKKNDNKKYTGNITMKTKLRRTHLFSTSLLAGMFFLCAIVQGSHAQQADEKTSPLSTLRVRNELLDQYFKDGINIHFDQTISTIINQPTTVLLCGIRDVYERRS